MARSNRSARLGEQRRTLRVEGDGPSPDVGGGGRGKRTLTIVVYHVHQLVQKLRKRWDDEENELCAAEEARFGILPERVVSDTPFKEESFGYPITPGIHFREAKNEMVFACSGISIPSGATTKLDVTRFVTSACLVREFDRKRNRDDKLRVKVRLPDDTITGGFLGLYDNDIAIVTSVGVLDVYPIDLDYKPTPVYPGDYVMAAGRVFNSGSSRAMDGVSFEDCSNIWVPRNSDTTKAVLGGPLFGHEVGNMPRFLGMNLALDHDKYTFLPLELLRERLELFQILKYVFCTFSIYASPKVIHFDKYSLPEGVSRIIPSGFMRTINRLKSLGYPLPPPLVLEFNGQLLNRFEGYFGELHAWKGDDFDHLQTDYSGLVWSRLPKKFLTKTSRRVVSLASFHGDIRFFVCTGLLIKLCGCTVVLTSASLVRKDDNEGSIDNNLKIEVSLPPNQRCSGTLEVYNLNYNIAIVSLEKRFYRTCPEDIFKTNLKSSDKVAGGHDNKNPKSGKAGGQDNKNPKSGKVVAIGRAADGLLMGTIGELKPTNEDMKLDCQELRVLTCKINKAGIGGPLFDLGGTFVGMNFYDGSRLTPFLPKSKIVDVLQTVFSLPQYCDDTASTAPQHIISDDGWPTRKNRWRVPQPYWYHGGLDVDWYELPKLPGRRLNVGKCSIY
ncbi:hypothetical protein BAE44_0024199 [Dichanthelium oligosanthes]|uniref:Uncharacterized protein n=1 Tax=Dichanthelium oligosanthes TaxID=888268 RepID=A0A1E5UPG8_9POAL|nr:hypothetical protein BAE44_0024199 [Dichanthelium oligosanthes]